MRVLRSAFPLLALVAVVSCSKTAASPSESSTAGRIVGSACCRLANAVAHLQVADCWNRRHREGDRIARGQDSGPHVGQRSPAAGSSRTTIASAARSTRTRRSRSARSRSTATGALDARFTIPEDYGGVHEVIALIDGKPVAQNGIEVTQSFETDSCLRPGGHADRAPSQGTWLADDGEHVGGELGQQPRGIRLRCGHEGVGSRAVPRGWTVRRSHGQDPHRISGSGLSELRAVARRASSAPAVHVPERRPDLLRR